MAVSRKHASSPGCALGKFLVFFFYSFPQLRAENFQKIKGGKRMGAKTPKAESLPPTAAVLTRNYNTFCQSTVWIQEGPRLKPWSGT